MPDQLIGGRGRGERKGELYGEYVGLGEGVPLPPVGKVLILQMCTPYFDHSSLGTITSPVRGSFLSPAILRISLRHVRPLPLSSTSSPLSQSLSRGKSLLAITVVIVRKSF